MLRAFRTASVLLAGSVMLTACGSTPSHPPPAAASPTPGSVVLRAEGSDYAAPIYQEVSNLLDGRRLTLNYHLIGVASAVARLPKQTVAFVASDSSQPLGDLPHVKDTSELYVPVAFGAVVVIYDVPGLHVPLRLRGGVLADIFLGRVRSWNDPEIAASNPGVPLPSMPIMPVHRSDATTVTDIFTQYLAAISPRWRKNSGSGASVSWPTGVAESDDASMRQIVAQTPGAIGYTDQATALQNNLLTVRLRNPAGDYVAPTLPAATAAGRQLNGPGDLSLPTIDARVPGAYPIVDEAYVLTMRDPCYAGLSLSEALGVRRVLNYLLGAGQRVAARLSFAPLPAGLRARARAEVGALRCYGQRF
jgi:phosphate transport system substrate-binding protein